MALLRRSPRELELDREIDDFLTSRTARAGAAPVVEPALAEDPDRWDIWARIDQTHALLAGYKRAELQLFARVRRQVRTGDAGARSSLEDARTAALYMAWATRLRELRALYELAGVPEEEWAISSPGRPRSATLEPALWQRIALLDGAGMVD